MSLCKCWIIGLTRAVHTALLSGSGSQETSRQGATLPPVCIATSKASVVTRAVRIYRKVKSKDTVLPTRAAVLLETDRYAFYFLLLYRMFQLESRPNREH